MDLDIDYWRAHAEEARAKASEMQTLGARKLLLEIAAAYDALALRAVRRLRPADQTVRSPADKLP